MLAALLFLALLIGLIILPYSVRFFIAFSSSIFQVYTLSCFGFYPSLALVSNFSLTPTLISLRRSLFQPPILCLLGLLVIQTLSLAWSPDRHFGFTTILYELPFIPMYLIAFHLAEKNLDQLIHFIKFYAVLSLVPLFIIILFAIDTHLNYLYVQSKIAHFFNHPHAIQWYLEGYPQHEWAGKPRGIIFDPNASGCYLGICALVFFGMGIYCHSTWLKCIAVLHWIGIFFTSVIAAMCLGIIFPLFILFVYFYSQNKTIYGRSFRSISFYVILTLLLCSIAVVFSNKKILHFFELKIISRVSLWKLAIVAMPGHLFTGLGFGGLEQIYANLYPPEISKPMYRPHNTLIAIWAQSGIMAAFLALAFIASVLFSCWRAFTTATNSVHKQFVLLISGGILWMFIHAMGENWGIVSEIHIQPLIATVYALMIGGLRGKQRS